MRIVLMMVVAVAAGCSTSVPPSQTPTHPERKTAAQWEAEFNRWMYSRNLKGSGRYNGGRGETTVWHASTKDSLEDVLKFYEQCSGITTLTTEPAGEVREDSTVPGRAKTSFSYNGLNFSKMPDDRAPREHVFGTRSNDAFYTVVVSQEPPDRETRIYVIRDVPDWKSETGR
jgi:hypothetical protein